MSALITTLVHLVIDHFYLLFYWEVCAYFALVILVGLGLECLFDRLFGTRLGAVPRYAYLGEVLTEEHN